MIEIYLRRARRKMGLIAFDFFAAERIFTYAVGDDAAAEFSAQGVHCGFDSLLLFLCFLVCAEQVELTEGLRLLRQMQCRDGQKTDRMTSSTNCVKV